MTIKTMNVTANFRYLWLKSVRDVNLREHCASCLVGDYVKGVHSGISELRDRHLREKVYYLCGVSEPYRHHRNFHLAFTEQKGALLEYEDNGIRVQIENAARLPISADYIDDSDPNAGKIVYSTCRNWQFAHYFKRVLQPRNEQLNLT